MNALTVFDYEGRFVVDSREIAEMLEKRHDNLLRDINGYVEILQTSNLRDGATVHAVDFFLPNCYVSGTPPRKYKSYLLTRKGCALVANKLTGEKGVRFTAEYVTRFEEMERQLQPKSIEDLIILQAQSMKQLREDVSAVHERTQALDFRLNNLDRVNVTGSPRQQLEGMVKKYAFDKGLLFPVAWKHFDQAFNTAYRKNLTALRLNYSRGRKPVTRPAYLEATGLVDDAIRVMDKLLNEG